MRKISLNGRFLPESEARVSIYDSSLMWGDTVFEMMRTFNKTPFKLREHMERLSASWNYTGISLPYSVEDLIVMHEDLLAANLGEFGPDDEIRSLVNVSRGILPIYESMGLPMEPWVMIAAFPLKPIVKGAYKLYTEGVHAVVTSQRTIPAQYLDPKVKNRSRLHYKIAEIEAKRTDPAAWALLLDDQGFITEGAGSNFFIVKNRALHTPEGRNCLRGISRDCIFSIAAKNERNSSICNLELYDAMNADEAFFTNTPYCIVPITKLNGKPVGDGKVGKLTKFLMHKWGESVGLNFVDQARKWDDV